MPRETFDDRFIDASPDTHGILIERHNDLVHTNVPHLLVYHSPAGFNFGYGGSGPADLALNILEWHLQHTGFQGPRIPCFHGSCFRVAWDMHQQFKQDVIAQDRPAISLPLDALAAWVNRHLPPPDNAPPEPRPA